MKYYFHVLFFFLSLFSFNIIACDLYECTYGKVGVGIGVSNHVNKSLPTVQIGLETSLTDDYHVGIDALSFFDGKNIEELGAELYLKNSYQVNNDAQLYLSGGVSSFNGLAVLGGGLLYSISDRYSVDIAYKFHPSFSDELKNLYLFNIGFVYDFGYKEKNLNNIVLTSRPSDYVEDKTVGIYTTSRKDKLVNYKQYIVKKGDCLSCIAADKRVSIEYLRSINFWVDVLYLKGKEDLIIPGQVLNL